MARRKTKTSVRERIAKRRKETARRRARRRTSVSRERQERIEQRRREARRRFLARGRKGSFLKLDFEFSGLPVPVDRPDDPDGKALVRQTELVRALEERDGQSLKDN